MCTNEPPHQITNSVMLTGLSQYTQCVGRLRNADCGFFAGTALKLLHQGRGNPERRNTGRQEVYGYRESFLHRVLGITSQVDTHRDNHPLAPQHAVSYLTGTLGLPGVYRIHAVGATDNQVLWQQHMSQYKGTNAALGLMFCLLGSDGNGHWASVIQYQADRQILGRRGREPAFRIYDPSEIPGRPTCMTWLAVEEAVQRYQGLQNVVSAGSLP